MNKDTKTWNPSHYIQRDVGSENLSKQQLIQTPSRNLPICFTCGMLTESMSACRHTYKADSSPRPSYFLPPLPSLSINSLLCFFLSFASPRSVHSVFFTSALNSGNLFSSLSPSFYALNLLFSLSPPLPCLVSISHYIASSLSSSLCASSSSSFPSLSPPPPRSSLPPIAATVWSWMRGLGRDWSFRVECSGVRLFVFFIGMFGLIHCMFRVWESMLCLSVIGRWPRERVCVCPF